MVVFRGEVPGYISAEGLDQHGRPATAKTRQVALRALCQDVVEDWCQKRRDQLWAELTQKNPDWSQAQVQAEVDRQQPMYSQYDPVVQMAITSIDHRQAADLRLRAMAEVASYVRPKLKSVEVVVEAQSPEEMQRRAELRDRILGLLEAGADAKRDSVIDGDPPRSVGQDAGAPADGAAGVAE